MRRFLLVLVLMGLAGGAFAQERRPSHCIAIADAAPGLDYVKLASLGDPLDPYAVRISYVDHSMFAIETAGGLTAVTDFTGFLGTSGLIPDVVTMNNAHDSHWTAFPDPAIPHVLEGWARGRVAADHHLDLGEMLVRNVPTDIRGGFGGRTIRNGNSIFVFEVAGLCIGHLGHLHHEPDDAQYAALGRLDVVMAAVDGGLTLDLPTMTRVLKRLRSSIVIPMHWFSGYTLGDFVAGMSDSFDIRDEGETSLVVSLATLPPRPTVVVLRPRYLRDE